MKIFDRPHHTRSGHPPAQAGGQGLCRLSSPPLAGSRASYRVAVAGQCPVVGASMVPGGSGGKHCLQAVAYELNRTWSNLRHARTTPLFRLTRRCARPNSDASKERKPAQRQVRESESVRHEDSLGARRISLLGRCRLALVEQTSTFASLLASLEQT